MDGLDVVQFIKKAIKERQSIISDCLEGNGISSMEQYQHCMGEMNALSYINQELSDLLEKQERIDDEF